MKVSRFRPKCSMSMIDVGSYRTEHINRIMLETTNQDELLIYYLDYIRNYKVLDDTMIQNINNFSDYNKMFIIQEFNIIMKSCIEHISTSNGTPI
jgi:hypothetical protein